jgi:hypothetical protein
MDREPPGSHYDKELAKAAMIKELIEVSHEDDDNQEIPQPHCGSRA